MQIEEADPVAVLKLAAGTDRLGHPAPQRIMSLTESISPCCRQNDLTAARPASQIAALHIMQISAALNLGTYMSQSTRPGPEHDRFSNAGFDHQLTHSEVSCESADQISQFSFDVIVSGLHRETAAAVAVLYQCIISTHSGSELRSTWAVPPD